MIGYPLQYSWASLVAQLVKNTAAMQETYVQFLGWEDPLEKGKATHSSISGLENSVDYVVHGVAKSQTRLSDFHTACGKSLTRDRTRVPCSGNVEHWTIREIQGPGVGTHLVNWRLTGLELEPGERSE